MFLKHTHIYIVYYYGIVLGCEGDDEPILPLIPSPNDVNQQDISLQLLAITLQFWMNIYKFELEVFKEEIKETLIRLVQ